MYNVHQYLDSHVHCTLDCMNILVTAPPITMLNATQCFKGGSWISTGDEASRFARFSFRRHFFQHMGFRMVRSTSSLPPPVRLCKAEVFVLGCGVTGV